MTSKLKAVPEIKPLGAQYIDALEKSAAKMVRTARESGLHVSGFSITVLHSCGTHASKWDCEDVIRMMGVMEHEKMHMNQLVSVTEANHDDD